MRSEAHHSYGHLYNPLIMFVNDKVWGKLTETEAALYDGPSSTTLTTGTLRNGRSSQAFLT